MTETKICNQALAQVRARSIEDINESTLEAEKCKLYYETARNAVLEEFPWNFTKKRITLALLSSDGEYEGWTNAYQYPTDCVKALRIYDGSGALTGTSYDIDTDSWEPAGRVQFEVSVNTALTGKVILTEKEDAVLIYTARVTDANLFSATFIEALAVKLAIALAQPLRGDSELKRELQLAYSLLINQAEASNAQEEHTIPEADNTYVDSR